MHLFVLGAISMGFWVAGLFFLRFWRQTDDRLFLIFALAFWLLALGRFLLAFVGEAEERTYIYLIRLVAFLLIIAAIVDKNRAAGRQARSLNSSEPEHG